MIVPYRQLLTKIPAGRWALPTFNTFNLEMTRAIVDAAEASRAPVVIEVSRRALEYAGRETLVRCIAEQASRARVPIAVHYDHGTTLDEIRAVLPLGFSSVMVSYDIARGLKYSAALARSVVTAVRGKQVVVQGEVGRVTGPKYHWRLPKNWLTDPEQAEQYVVESRADSISVSVGNRHGIAAGSVQIDLKRLRAIRERVSVPLVLHGGSGLRRAGYPAVIRAGISVINFDTDLRFAFASHLRRGLARQEQLIDPRPTFARARNAVQRVVQDKIRICGAAQRATLFT